MPMIVCEWPSCGQSFILNELALEEHLRTHHANDNEAGRCRWQDCTPKDVSGYHFSLTPGETDFWVGSESEAARVGQTPRPALDLRAVLPRYLPGQAQHGSPREDVQGGGAGALRPLHYSLRVADSHEPARSPMRSSSYTHPLIVTRWARLS
jgi:hypothetical protein